MPTSHAAKLIKLGLAEVSCGRLEQTPLGRRAARRVDLRSAGSFRDR
ncbi:MAG: hypothetical protein AAFP68_21705 [Pseudomonadota bacterium]